LREEPLLGSCCSSLFPIKLGVNLRDSSRAAASIDAGIAARISNDRTTHRPSFKAVAEVRFGAWAVVAVEGNDGRQWGRIRPFGPGAPLPQLWDGVRPTHRARAAAALPEACRHVPYIVLRLATLAPGSLRENNEQ
jgi:hypothetical protein